METVVQNLNQNISHAKRIIQDVVPRIPEKRDCLCATALQKAIMTDANVIPKETRQKLGILVDKYLPQS